MAIVFDDEAPPPKKARIVFDDAPPLPAKKPHSFKDELSGYADSLGRGLSLAMKGTNDLVYGAASTVPDFAIGAKNLVTGTNTRGAGEAYKEWSDKTIAPPANGGEMLAYSAPSLLAPPITKGMATAQSLLGRMGQGAGLGAIYGLAQPGNGEDRLQAGVTGAAVGGTIPAVGSAASTIGSAGRRTWDSVFRSDKGIDRLIRDHINNIMTKDAQQAVIPALRNPKQPISDPTVTVAEAVSHIPQGAALREQQRITAATKGKSAEDFNVLMGQSKPAVLAEAIAERTRVTKPMREGSLGRANQLQGEIDALQKEIADLGSRKTTNEVTKYRFDSLAHTMESQAQDVSPVRGIPRVPGRYTPHQAVADDAKVASGEVQTRIQELSDKLGTAKKELTAIYSTGVKPLDAGAVRDAAFKLRLTPDLRASSTVKNAVVSFGNKLDAVKKEFGNVTVDDLYRIRKELGIEIENVFSKDSQIGRHDKVTAAEVQNTIQDIIDKSITEAGGGKAWKEYLETYSKHSQAIEDFQARLENMYKPIQPVTLGGGAHNVAEESGVKAPQFIDRNFAIANWLGKRLRGGTEPRIDARMGNLFRDPKALADLMDKSPALSDALSQYLRRASVVTPAALATQVGKE